MGVHSIFPISVPVLDSEFDLDEEFEAAVLDSISRCGTIDVHPNAWGVHDGIGAYTDGDPVTPPDILARWRAEDAEKKRNKAIQAAKDAEEKQKKDKCTLRTLAVSSRDRARKCFERFLAEQTAWSGPSAEARSSMRKALEPLVSTFPHCVDYVLVSAVIVEFMDSGWKDAEQRKMPMGEWLWKRSRFMAGFR